MALPTPAPVADPATVAPTQTTTPQQTTPQPATEKPSSGFPQQQNIKEKFRQKLEEYRSTDGKPVAPKKKISPVSAQPETKPVSANTEETQQPPPPEGKQQSKGGESPDSNDSPPAATDDKNATPTTQEDKSKPAKSNPWKLVDEYKKRLSIAEQEIADTKSRIVPEAERKAIEARLEAAEKRVKEYEDEIRFTNYQKHPEFEEKYNKPYESEFKRAMSELSQIAITDPATGETRAATDVDFYNLVHLPLGEAKKQADLLFGDFANDAMAYRRSVRALSDARNNALEEAKKTGFEREKQRAEQQQKTFKQMQEQVSTLWKQENEKAVADEKYGSYFKPREGDTEWNNRLEKGFKLVDEAMSANPFDAKHTPEERAEIIRKHTAMRHRAASWGAVRYENELLKTKLAEREKELEGFKNSTPTTGGTTTSTAATQPTSVKEMLRLKMNDYRR